MEKPADRLTLRALRAMATAMLLTGVSMLMAGRERCGLATNRR